MLVVWALSAGGKVYKEIRKGKVRNSETTLHIALFRETREMEEAIPLQTSINITKLWTFYEKLIKESQEIEYGWVILRFSGKRI